jgi:predicted RNase H-like nuclease (RuvC/YqgF family)
MTLEAGDEMREEIERLRAEVKQLQDVIVQQARNRDNGYAKRDAEIERLRERLDAGLNVRDKEIERLRQLLRDAGVPEWVINPDENT